MRIASLRRTRMPAYPGLLARATALALGLALLGGPAATAAEEPAAGERVPLVVANYIDSGLVPRLTELYAPAADGTGGIPFDETTLLGATLRVSVWSDAFLAGEATDAPTQLSNDWVVPVSLGERPTGLAMVWINPSTNDVELADFTPDAALAETIAAAPGGATLVHDDAHSAWFAVTDATVTPLAPGASRIQAPLPIADAQAMLSAAGPEQQQSSPVPLATGLLLLAVIVALAVFVMLPSRRRRADAVGAAADLRHEHPVA